MEIREFGITKCGLKAHLYVLKNQYVECHVTDYGTSLVRVLVPDRAGNRTDIVLGFDDVSGYEQDTASIGCNVGRCANCIGNASFELDGTTYLLEKNNGENCLHSGYSRYSNRMWKVEEYSDEKIVFSLESPHMDQGFPGNVKLYIMYKLKNNKMTVSYRGVPDRDTLMNVANHSYFNLNGEGSGSVLDHYVKINAETFTPNDRNGVPTGEIREVAKTPMDFRNYQRLGTYASCHEEQMLWGSGYDHNFCLNHDQAEVREAVDVYAEKTGIEMIIQTNYPGLQLYTANHLNEVHGKQNHIYRKQEAVCFEPQFYPDAIHKTHFPSPVVRAGEEFCKENQYLWKVRSV